MTKNRLPGATTAGIFSLALSSVLLLCGAGLTPTGSVQKSDINANGFSLTHAATVSATNVYANTVVATNGFMPPASFVLAVTNGGTGTSAGWELKSANFTAVAGHKYQIDTSSGAVTVTLPASATAMDAVEFADAKLTWDSHNVTLGRNGLNLGGGTSDYTDGVKGDRFLAVYLNDTYGWSVK